MILDIHTARIVALLILFTTGLFLAWAARVGQ